MNFYKLFIAIILGITSSYCKSQVPVSSVQIVQPTIEQEATSIWRTINDITFFEQQGYKIHLPKDPLIDSLITKSKNDTFGAEDFPAIYELVETKIFNQESYEKAIQKATHQVDLINEFIAEIDILKEDWDWNFNSFEEYKIRFTLYGTGGSYDPDEGIITLFTDADGNFMNYENPVNTIIHEITHIGMEYSIVQKYNLPHGLKERLVDTFVYLMFKDELPEYKIQNMGDSKIDNFLNKKQDLNALDRIVAEFLN